MINHAMIDKKIWCMLHITCKMFLKKIVGLFFCFLPCLFLACLMILGLIKFAQTFSMPCCICDMLYGAYNMSNTQPIVKPSLF